MSPREPFNHVSYDHFNTILQMLHKTRKKRVKSPAIKEETALFEITFNNEISGTFIFM